MLRHLLSYCPTTGSLKWNIRPRTDFDTEFKYKRYHTRSALKVAGCVDKHGYVIICFQGVNYKAHRLAWAHYYGEFPKGQLDHKNRDKADNRIVNLRDVDGHTNCHNRSTFSNNSSGYTGVCWNKKQKKWQADITKRGVRQYLGLFTHKQDAINARKAAELKIC